MAWGGVFCFFGKKVGERVVFFGFFRVVVGFSGKGCVCLKGLNGVLIRI